MNLKVHYLFLLWLIGLATFGQLAYGVILLFSVIVHELGHILTAANLKIQTLEVELMPFGGVAHFNRLLGSDPGGEAAIALAGPANSLVLLVAGLMFSGHPFGMMLMEANALLLLVNLLPVLPLDGGRVLRGYLARKEGVRRGSQQLLRYTVVGAVILLGLCIVLAYIGVFTVNAVVLACFVLYAARKERKMLPFIVVNHLSNLTGSLGNRGLLPVKTLAVRDGAQLKSALNSLVPDHYHMFLVIDSLGHHRIVTEDIFLAAVNAYGYNKTFGEIK